MSFRFRRRIKLMPGVHLNVNKKSLSLSAGVRGAHITKGTTGTRATVGIPGSGLSYTTHKSRKKGESAKKGSPRKIRSSSTKTKREAEQEEKQRQISKNEGVVEKDQKMHDRLLGIHKEAEPIPPEAYWKNALEVQAYGGRKGYEPEPNRALVRYVVSQVVEENIPLTRTKRDIAALLLFLGFANLYWQIPLIVAVLGGLVFVVLLETPTRAVERGTDALYALVEGECREEQVRNDLESAEAAKEHLCHEKKRIKLTRDAIGGSTEAIGVVIEDRLSQMNFPVEMDAAFEVVDSSKIMLDVDLPEIDDCVPRTRKTLMKSGKLKEEGKTKTQMNEDYAQVVTGIAFRLASEMFRCSPRIETVLVSGYTQLLDRSTGQDQDTYVYSVVIEAEKYQNLDFARLSPVDAFSNFTNRMDVTKRFHMNPIDPMVLGRA
jgi:hypothetical protein